MFFLLLTGVGSAVFPQDRVGARQRLGDTTLSLAARTEAARQLLPSDQAFLVGQYPIGDNALVLRHLLGTETSPAAMALGLKLFAAVEGEERIDFEVYLLKYGEAGVSGLVELLKSRQVGLVLQVLDALGKLGAASAADRIAPLLGHDEVWIRMGAAHALGEVGASDYGPQLVAALDDTAYAVVNAALVGLGRLRWQDAYKRIEALSGHQRPQVRRHAAHALGQLARPESAPRLRNMAANDPDSGVRYMADRALARLQGDKEGGP
jgi:HEAT repeat protein